MALTSQGIPTTKPPHFATLLVMALDPAEVGGRIRKARLAKGWTHEQLRDEYAAATGNPKPGLRTVQRWQTGVSPQGKSWLPKLSTLMDLADLFDVPRSYFVEDQESPVTLHDLQAQLEELRSAVDGLRSDLLPGADGPAKPRAGRR